MIELLPWLYLKGISTGDHQQALAALVGDDAKGLSANTVCRLKQQWTDEHKLWSQRDLSRKRYVYWWADGVYSNLRMDERLGNPPIFNGQNQKNQTVINGGLPPLA